MPVNKFRRCFAGAGVFKGRIVFIAEIADILDVIGVNNQAV